MASQPINGWKVLQRPPVLFRAAHAFYIEPSDFNYSGLRKQRDEGAYDNFLRSNIDNEQKKRNFNVEAGRDHLPFRSWEGMATDKHFTIKNQMPESTLVSNFTAAPGVPVIVPLRWNNPHSSELEVNVWIMENKYVVPIRRPTCSGEGYGDNVFTFTIPADFNSLGSQVPNFAGCVKVGDCVLQVYAHSVESRTYAIGRPLIVSGFDPTTHSATATDTSKISPAGVDSGTDLSKLRALCLPSNDPSADITTAQPRFARLISDVYNSAYQNSDYSPYSGQQPESISKNMQASCILKMVSGDRGELGKVALLVDNRKAFHFRQQLDKKVVQVVQGYESVANNIINMVGARMATNASMGVSGLQLTAKCFRCAEVGSTTALRQTTTTYIPSFKIDDPAQIAAVRVLLPPEYAGLVSDDGVVQIYVAALNDLNDQFVEAAKLGLNYMGPMVKSTVATMADPTNFRKIDANGKLDNGLYAARNAASARAAVAAIARGNATNLTSYLQKDNATLPATRAAPVAQAKDMCGVDADSSCDSDATWTPDMTCSEPKQLFNCTPEELDAGGDVPVPTDSPIPTESPVPADATTSGQKGGNGGLIAAIVVIAVVLVLAGGAFYYFRSKAPQHRELREEVELRA